MLEVQVVNLNIGSKRTAKRQGREPLPFCEKENIMWIEIVFRNGDMCHYKPDDYTDYKYDGKYFIVIKDKQWIGFYNLDCVEYIEVSAMEEDENDFIYLDI